MVSIKLENDSILIKIPKSFLSNNYLERFLERIEAEEIAEKNQMNDDDVDILTQEITDNWLKDNEDRLMKRIEKYTDKVSY